MTTIETTTKYRLEEHYQNEKIYLLHGIYNKLQYAQNKKQKLINNGVNASKLFIIKEEKTITRSLIV